uniref:MFS transporter n=1 Tax=Alloprevotella sp. TaxID=1872471 RepID=UPI00402A5D1D
MSLQVHNQLSSSRFINMCVANWFLHIYIFSTIPLITDQLSKLSAPIGYAGLAMLTFAVGMFIPGPFGAHIMERRSRKEVFLKSLLAVGPLVILLLSYAKNYNEVLLITLLQGGAFGVAQTALGTTLVNDVLLSQHRNKGDLIYGWAGRIGIPLGIFFGYILHLI